MIACACLRVCVCLSGPCTGVRPVPEEGFTLTSARKSSGGSTPPTAATLTGQQRQLSWNSPESREKNVISLCLCLTLTLTLRCQMMAIVAKAATQSVKQTALSDLRAPFVIAAALFRASLRDAPADRQTDVSFKRLRRKKKRGKLRMSMFVPALASSLTSLPEQDVLPWRARRLGSCLCIVATCSTLPESAPSPADLPGPRSTSGGQSRRSRGTK